MVGRLQIFNNWSPWLVSGPRQGLDRPGIFLQRHRPLWKLSDEEMAQFAIEEVARIGILKAEDVEDSHVVRVPKTYPAYFGSYDRFDVIRNYIDRLRESLPGGPQRHAQIQQPGSLHADRHDRGRKHRQRRHHQGQYLGRQHRDGVSRKNGGKVSLSLLGALPGKRATGCQHYHRRLNRLPVVHKRMSQVIA